MAPSDSVPDGRPSPARRGATRGSDARTGDDSGGDRHGAAHGPAGLDRARQRSDAPPRGVLSARRSQPQDSAPVEPDLAEDAPVDVARGLRREVRRAVGDERGAERVLQHLTIALAALDARDGETALPHLRWVKGRFPRLAAVREALGVALYLEEDYRGAIAELSTHRRLTGSVAHNHLVADALRATGDGEDRIPTLVQQMVTDADEVDDAALAEGHIVWASWLADRGDPGAGRSVLQAVLDESPDDVEEHHLRTWYVAADLAERAGDIGEATRLFSLVAERSSSFFDTDQRLAALDDT